MTPVPSREALERMRRVDVQNLCADSGIRADLSTADMIDLLLHGSNFGTSMPLDSVGTMSMQGTRTTRPRRILPLTTTAVTTLHSHAQNKQLGSGATVAEGISRPPEKTERSSRRAPCTMDLQATGKQSAIVVPQHRKLKKKHYLTPVAPKRQSEFMLFRLEALADMKARFPGMSWAERVENVSTQWAAMPQTDKDVYKQRTLDTLAADREKYDTILAADAQDVSPCTSSTMTGALPSSQTQQRPPYQDTSPTYCAKDDICPRQRPNGVIFSDHNIQGQRIDLLTLSDTQHPGTFDPNFPGELTVSSTNCLQQNPMAIAMGSGAQYNMDVNSMVDICQMQNTYTAKPMGVYDTSFIDSMDLTGIINMGATNNAEWAGGITRMNDKTNDINDMGTISRSGQKQLDVSLGHSVTIILWFQPHTEPFRLCVDVPTFPHFALSGQAAIMSRLGLMPKSLVESYDQFTGHWTQQMVGSIRLVEKEQILLYKVRQGLQKGLDDNECPGLQNEIAWRTHYGQGVSASPGVRSASSGAAGTPEAVSGGYTDSADDIYQYIYLPNDTPEGTPPPTQASPDTNVRRPEQDAAPAVNAATAPGTCPSAVTSTTLGNACPQVDYARECANRELTLTWDKENMYTAEVYNNEKRKGEPTPASVSCSPHFFPKRPHPPLRRWPVDFTVSEVTRGFHRMQIYESLFHHDIRREAFQHVFGCKFVLPEFQRHYDIWQNANPSLRARFEDMEDDDENAMWGEFEQAMAVQQDEDLPLMIEPPARVLSGKTRYLTPRLVHVKPKVNMAYYKNY